MTFESPTFRSELPEGPRLLATFVIGLREGIEASLIVGIIAAFLALHGRRDTLRLVWIGVGVGVALCIGVAIGLQVLSASLPEGGQQTVETIVGAVAVGMVTYMVVWMRHHARGLKRHLESATSHALVEGTAWALVGLAFFAVLREGFETAVFLLAAFQASSSELAASVGALAGIVTAIGLGWAIFRGGMRINLGRFFRLTGLVLVLVAAGLVASTLHSAAEIGWITFGQGTAVDLSWLIRPGSVWEALITGVLGLRAQTATIELLGWLAYLVPVALFVAWPVRSAMPSRPAPVEVDR
jgi:high-affinity iron transporter